MHHTDRHKASKHTDFLSDVCNLCVCEANQDTRAMKANSPGPDYQKGNLAETFNDG